MVIDIPIAIALGFDQPTKGLMARPPRPVGAPVLSRANWVRLCIQGAVMTVGALVAYQIGDDLGGPVVGATMLLTTLSIFHVVAGLLSRDQLGTIFDRDAVPGAAQLRRYGVAVLAIVAITTIDLLQRIFGTTRLTADQWGDLRRPRREPAGGRGAHQARSPAAHVRLVLPDRPRGRQRSVLLSPPRRGGRDVGRSELRRQYHRRHQQHSGPSPGTEPGRRPISRAPRVSSRFPACSHRVRPDQPGG